MLACSLSEKSKLGSERHHVAAVVRARRSPKTREPTPRSLAQRPETEASASPHAVSGSPGSGLLGELNGDCDPIRQMGFSWLGKIFKHLGPLSGWTMTTTRQHCPPGRAGENLGVTPSLPWHGPRFCCNSTSGLNILWETQVW